MTESILINSQPYQIITEVSVDYSAKGVCQPKAKVSITRNLETTEGMTEIIRADLARGVEEMMLAIQEIEKIERSKEKI